MAFVKVSPTLSAQQFAATLCIYLCMHLLQKHFPAFGVFFAFGENQHSPDHPPTPPPPLAFVPLGAGFFHARSKYSHFKSAIFRVLTEQHLAEAWGGHFLSLVDIGNSKLHLCSNNCVLRLCPSPSPSPRVWGTGRIIRVPSSLQNGAESPRGPWGEGWVSAS